MRIDDICERYGIESHSLEEVQYDIFYRCQKEPVCYFINPRLNE